MSDVVVVESPAKAKTINRYLGGGFTVLASLGHVRDLPPKDGSVRPEQDFAMDWQSDSRGEKQVGAIAKALKGASTLYLATDPDREGEAISWHVQAMLADRKALKGVKVRRITFNEITRSAVRAAMSAPSRRNASSATPTRPSPPLRCNRKPPASSASARSKRCAWRSSSTKASTSMARPSG
jgi:DNA topoisomerase-1